MTNGYERQDRERGLAFSPKSQLMSGDDVTRALRRMAHEVIEHNHEPSTLSMVGLQTGGEPFARRLTTLIEEVTGIAPILGLLDVSFYRDDLSLKPLPRSSNTLLDHDLTGRHVVLVDDVLFTGRTIRAALNALSDWGRPQSVQLAVLVDRGHRELPIRPDYVGKNLPTSLDEAIRATLEGVWIGGPVVIDSLRGANLLSIDDLSTAAIVDVLDTAESFVEVNQRSVKKVPALRGRVVASLFFEESTRTRLSFETAAKRLSADVLSLAIASSSVKKGESLRDTIATIDALGIDAVVMRHHSSGAAVQVSRYVPHVRVVNAGDGQHQHPTQGLLDAFTIRQLLAERAGLEPVATGSSLFEGLKVLIVGDLRHSRVARSDVDTYTRLGAEVRVAGPGTLLPDQLASWPVTRAEDFDAALEWADVVGLLRLQQERGSGSFVPSLGEFTATYGLTVERARRLRPETIIMHPGPINRGVEIDSRVADLASAVIDRQVTNGVPIRMAVLYLCVAGERGES